MDIKDLVGDIESIFNPKVTFDGYYAISSNILCKASKYDKNINLVQEFLYKNYYCFFFPNFETFLSSINIPLVFCSELDNGYGRKVGLLVDIYIRDYIASLFDNKTFKDNDDIESIRKENKRFLKEKIESIKAFFGGKKDFKEDKDLVNAFNSLKKSTLNQLERLYTSNEDKMILMILKKNQNELIKYVLNELKKALTKLSLHYDSIVKDMDKTLELSKLDSLINYDILYLSLAKYFMNDVKDNLEKDLELPPSVLYLYKYYNALKTLKIYSYTIDDKGIFLDSIKKRKYSTKDFIKEFESIVLPINDPEVRYYQIMEKDNTRNYRLLDNVQKKMEELKDIDASRELAVGWDFVPKGELLEPREKSSTRSERSSKKVDLETREERLEEVLKRQQFLDNTPYIYKAQGKNKFDGYVAYIYGNGYILFEKFYENLKTMLPSKSNATYVMTTDNFVEMSKLSKPEIIEYIKNGNTDVARKNHTSSWEANILNIINSSFYSKEIVAKIDRLISLGKIEERKLEKSYE